MIQVFRILCLIGLWLSGLLLYEHVAAKQGIEASSFCKAGQVFDCNAVAKSEWSEIFGLPLASWGIAFYLLLFILGLAAAREKLIPKSISAAIFLLITSLASLFSVFLFLISHFYIGKLCPFCLATYAINFALLFTAYKLTSGSLIQNYKQAFFSMLRFPLVILGTVSNLSLAQKSLARLSLLIFVVTLFLASIAEEYISDKMVTPQVVNRQLLDLWNSQPVQDLKLNLSQNAFADHLKGAHDAKIQIVEFSDFECPSCRKLFKILEGILKKYPGKVSVIHKNFPLDNQCNKMIDQKFHEYACYLASYARCAGEQGKFWEATAAIVDLTSIDNKNSGLDPKSELIQSAQGLGLDQQAIDECIGSGRQLEIIKTDVQQAIELNIQGTPSIWINGKRFEGFAVDDFETVINSVLQAESKS